ncbi:hypothetical protein Pmani_038907 [Petrolisthes manimaculis]|uniref:Uncharacterized protein n=1 Tax=Petrolisthes manimaculis TaxID=1843537 RepID=A0AAE1NDR5_9EUCA|nr:hypothetical protein Pmani_038907 [Petrolisthes manimaculis]
MTYPAILLALLTLILVGHKGGTVPLPTPQHLPHNTFPAALHTDTHVLSGSKAFQPSLQVISPHGKALSPGKISDSSISRIPTLSDAKGYGGIVIRPQEKDKKKYYAGVQPANGLPSSPEYSVQVNVEGEHSPPIHRQYFIQTTSTSGTNHQEFEESQDEEFSIENPDDFNVVERFRIGNKFFENLFFDTFLSSIFSTVATLKVFMLEQVGLGNLFGARGLIGTYWGIWDYVVPVLDWRAQKDFV